MQTQSVPRPAYETDAARLRARIAILEATPQTASRDTLIRWYRVALKKVEVTR